MVRIIKIGLLFILVVILNSCYTKKQCNRFCDNKTEIIIKDSIITKIKDTIIYVKIKPDTLFNVDTIIIINNKVINTPKSILQNEFSISEAWINNNKLKHNLVSKDTTLLFRLDNALKETEYYKNVVVKASQEETYVLKYKIKNKNKIILILSISLLIMIELKFKFVSKFLK